MTNFNNNSQSSLQPPSANSEPSPKKSGEGFDCEVEFSHPLVEEAFLSLKPAISHFKGEDLQDIIDSCHFGDKAHIKDKRKSGEPYITHPIAVAEIIAGLGLDRDTIIAAVLHDTVEDTDVTLEQVSDKFGDTVATLVDGVTKLKSSKHNKQQNKAATFHKILLSTLDDPRVLIIKLSDRLHNMSTLGAVAKEKQQATARETLNFYIPFARVMGMNDIADHIEILCYRNLDPDMYSKLSDKLLQLSLGRDLRQDKILRYLQKLLHRKQIRGHFRIIDNKVGMYRQFFHNRGHLNQLIRTYTFEVVLDNITACRSLADYLINKYDITDDQVADNIHHPLPGGNQSLTLTYHYEYDSIKLVILTKDMRESSTLGVLNASNSSEISQSVIRASLRNMKGLLLQHHDNIDSDQLDFDTAENVIEELISYLNERKIICYSPLGQAYELPKGSTALDFAYAVGPFVGQIATHAIIDKQEVDLATVVENSQQITIITDKNAIPKAEWLGFVFTAKARDLISSWLARQSIEDKQTQGKQALSRALQTYDKKLDDLTDSDWENILQWQNIDSKEKLYENITYANPLPQLVVARLFSEEIRQQQGDHDPSKDLLDTLSGVEITFVKCCNPIHGDPIRGYNSKHHGLVVHRHKCYELKAISKRSPERVFSLNWRGSDDSNTARTKKGNRQHFLVYLDLNMLVSEDLLSLAVSNLKQIHIGFVKVQVTDKTTILHIVVRDRCHMDQGIDLLRNLLGFASVQRLYNVNESQ